jgi:hypothetical protein
MYRMYVFGAIYVGALSSLYYVQTQKTLIEWQKHNEMARRIQRLDNAKWS